jgi:hypothetical protein
MTELPSAFAGNSETQLEDLDVVSFRRGVSNQTLRAWSSDETNPEPEVIVVCCFSFTGKVL